MINFIKNDYYSSDGEFPYEWGSLFLDSDHNIRNESENKIRIDYVDINEYYNKDDIFIYPIEIPSNMEFVHFFNNNRKINLDNILKLKKYYIMIISPNDSIVESEIAFDLIHEWCKINNIPNDKILFSYVNQMVVDDYEKWSENLQKINVFTDNWILDKFSYVLNTIKEKLVDYNDLNDKPKKYKFLSYNRSLKPHRLSFGYIMYKNNFLEKNLVSFLNHDGNKINKYLIPDADLKDFDETYSNFMSKKFTIDTDDLDKTEFMSGHFAWSQLNKNHYLDSYFSIVTESLYDSKVVKFTEKIYKPLVNFHPFILIGAPHSLKYLRKLGFKTFDGWIDEDYDNIECPKTRMGHITEEIKKIDKMTDDILLTMMSEMKPILKHNREKMIWYAKNGTRYDFFHKILNNLG